jgi:hypothetical protein
MKLLLILGIIGSSLAVLYFLWGILLIMSMANHPDSQESFNAFGTGLLISVVCLIGCVILLRSRRGVK